MRTEKKNKVICIIVTEEIYRKIAEIAEENLLPISSAARMIILRYLRERDAKRTEVDNHER